MKKILKKLKGNAGFTLLEMTIVILIIAMLLLIIIPNIGNVEKSVNKTTTDAIVQTVESQKVIYRIDENLPAGSEVDVNSLVPKYISEEQQKIYEDAKK